MDPLQRAEQLADVLQFEVPESHRQGVQGQAITQVKRALVNSLKPLHLELLKRQRHFNQELTRSLRLLRTRSVASEEAQSMGVVLAGFLEVGPPTPAGGSALERLLQVARRGYLKMVAPVLQSALETQGAWNEAMVALVAGAGSWPALSRRDAYARLASLSQSADPMEAWKSSGHRSVTEPLWREVFRRQTDFNREIIAVLAETFRVHQPAAPRPAGEYDDWWRSHEPAQIRESLRRAGALSASPKLSVVSKTRDALTADFVCFLGEHDALAPHALAEVALAIAQRPDVDVLYADEDWLDSAGTRVNPFFKPGWSPDLLRATPYWGSFFVVRRTLLEGLESFRGYELALHLSERTSRIERIPRVLSHRRPGAETDVPDVRALREHLRRSGVHGAHVTIEGPAHFRVQYPMTRRPLVSIIVPFRDKPALLRTLVESLLPRTRYPNFELVLVSNQSEEPATVALLESLTDPRVRKLEWNHPFNFSAINNFGVQQSLGEVLCFLNNDIEVVQDDWLDELVAQALRPEIGVVGPKLVFPDGTLQHVGMALGIQGLVGHTFVGMPDAGTRTPFGSPDWPRDLLAVTGACLAMRRETFHAVHGFDEAFTVVGSDVELCLRVGQRGLRVLYTPYARLVHDESSTRGQNQVPENDLRLSLKAYRPYLQNGDPFYNPNLSLEAGDGGLR